MEKQCIKLKSKSNMKAYKNKLKRDIVGSNVFNSKYGVYIKAVRNYQKGEEIFIGVLALKDREMFDLLVKKIK
jgi:hypothetical protein